MTHAPNMDTNTTDRSENPAASGVGSGDLLGGLRLSGCKDHPHRLDLSCCKIRREDGTPLSVADTWAEIQRLRDALTMIAEDRRAMESENAQLRAELGKLSAQGSTASPVPVIPWRDYGNPRHG